NKLPVQLQRHIQTRGRYFQCVSVIDKIFFLDGAAQVPAYVRAGIDGYAAVPVNEDLKPVSMQPHFHNKQIGSRDLFFYQLRDPTNVVHSLPVLRATVPLIKRGDARPLLPVPKTSANIIKYFYNILKFNAF